MKRIYSFFTILFLGKVISIREFSINIFVVGIICSDSVDLLFLCSCSVELREQVPPFRTLWLSNFKLTLSLRKHCFFTIMYLSWVFLVYSFRLKSQQGLLVDFCAFPQKFVDLLELCREEEQRDSPK